MHRHSSCDPEPQSEGVQLNPTVNYLVQEHWDQMLDDNTLLLYNKQLCAYTKKHIW